MRAKVRCWLQSFLQMTTTPFSLRIFVADGDPDGLRIVDKSNWIGKALVFPPALLPQV